MRIELFTVKSFGIIDNKTFDFHECDGITLLIGNNGSGKSNLLECISDIFSSLYNESVGRPFRFKSDFDLSWAINDIKYEAKYDKNGLKKTINGAEESATQPFVLPSRVVALYSGESTRLLERYYEPAMKFFVASINKGARDALTTPEYPKMLYFDKRYWEIALLSLLSSPLPSIQSFCRDALGILKVDEISFVFSPENFERYSINSVLSFVRGLKGAQPFQGIDEFRSYIAAQEMDSSDLFKYLYLSVSANNSAQLIKNTTVLFNDGLYVNDLSEGDKKRLLIKAALEFAGQENTLFLLDEPDAHVHVGNKKRIVKDVMEYSPNRHIIMTSHSPSICRAIANPKSIILMDHGAPIQIHDQIEAGHKLVDNSLLYNVLFSNKNIVITEGKSDCQYIQKTLDLFPDLYPLLRNETEFIPIGGTDAEMDKYVLQKIPQMEGRKIIRLVDRDESGLKCARYLLDDEDGHLKKNDFNGFRPIPLRGDMFLLMLPPPPPREFSKDFLIEDYFTHNKLIELAKSHLDERFTDSFGQFPGGIKEHIKRFALPAFCKNEATPRDMELFKVLLDKLEEKLMTP